MVELKAWRLVYDSLEVAVRFEEVPLCLQWHGREVTARVP